MERFIWKRHKDIFKGVGIYHITCPAACQAADARRESTVTIISPSFGPGIKIPYRSAPDAQCIVR